MSLRKIPDLEQSIRTLGGIGQKRADAFARLGILSLRDLLWHFPRGYQNRGRVRLLREGLDGEVSSFRLTVSTPPKPVQLPGRLALLKFRAFDESGRCEIVYFRQGYLKDVFTVGAEFRFFGKLQKRGSVFTLTAPQYEPILPGQELPPYHAVHPLTEGLTEGLLTAAIRRALSLPIDWEKADPLPAKVRAATGLLPLHAALEALHFPKTAEALLAARRRFLYEELFCFALGMTFGKVKEEGVAPVCKVSEAEDRQFLAALPFSLTGAQMRVIGEIRSDLTDPRGIPMARLVSGDVGSGKTVCAAAAAYFAKQNGLQTALMVPTEILAWQHASDLSHLLAPLGVRVAVLTGSLSAGKKQQICRALAAGELDLLIGTHALLTDTVQFAALGLVITDEQHRFGIFQRSALLKKGMHPHVLVMSATPIPRTLALILYGDLARSAVDELPPGRQKIDTFVVDESYRSRLDAFLDKQVAEGHQAYVVCPGIESVQSHADPEEGEIIPFSAEAAAFTGSDGLASSPQTDGDRPFHSAVEYADRLSELLPHRRIALLHGKLRSAEKEAVMARFAAGEIDILVSTTVIEVGVNVPNATLMLVENAERFGLSQLHQLRGRVGRGRAKAYCILVSDAKGENARKRLEIMRSLSDGYRIAEEDLKLRGPGDFFPRREGEARQHGAFEFRLADLCTDFSTLQEAFAEARAILAADPALTAPEHAALRSVALAHAEQNRQTLH